MATFQMLAAAASLVERIAAARRRAQTQRILDGLPDYIRKDIGWSVDRAKAPTYIGH